MRKPVKGTLNRQRVNVNQIIEGANDAGARDYGDVYAGRVQPAARSRCRPPSLLELVFQNLVSNALSYHRPGEALVIEISGGNSRDWWQFAVEDNDQGIPPA
jgi:signal transduction histidine kinase